MENVTGRDQNVSSGGLWMEQISQLLKRKKKLGKIESGGRFRKAEWQVRGERGKEVVVVAQEEEEGDLDLTDNRQAATSVEVCCLIVSVCV